MQVCFYKYLKIENEFIFYQIIVETSRSVWCFLLSYPFQQTICRKDFFMEKNILKDELKELILQQIGNYRFKNPQLLKQAFTRRSFTEENGGDNNEVLEFIGDKVLDIAVIRYLVKRFSNAINEKDYHATYSAERAMEAFSSSLKEGELTKLKQRLVQKDTLARRADELGIADFLIMGKGDIQNNRSQDNSVKEDLFEAIIGAIAIDSNWDFEKIQEAVEVMLCPDSVIASNDEIDYVSLIYQWTQSFGCVPWFKYMDSGCQTDWYFREPNTIYQSCMDGFLNRGGGVLKASRTCYVKMSDDTPRFAGYGNSKAEARKAACKLAYEYLEKNNLYFSIRDEIEEPSKEMAINQLEILARRGYFAIPEYRYLERHDENGNPVWKVYCSVNEIPCMFYGMASSKKLAKKAAAYKVLQYVLVNWN